MDKQDGVKLADCPSSKEVFDLFKQLNGVPRPSWHEEKVADFLCGFADRLGLEHERDANHCVVIRKPATKGYEQAVPVVMLNHADMVCVAEKGKAFDPLRDPIESYEDHGWLKARGTSLGADNGMGLSMALAVMQDDSIIHGPIECVATTNEEDGMTGAAQLSPSFIHGRKIINLDSEEYDTITIGSAGAFLQFSKIPFSRVQSPAGFSFYKIILSGGLGGHSGVDINKGRSNANKLMGELLDAIGQQMPVALSEFNGGEANNAIASYAEAVVGIPEEEAAHFTAATEVFAASVKERYGRTDGKVAIRCESVDRPATVIDRKASDAIVRSVTELPFGALQMSDTLPGVVETSNCTGMIKTNESDLFLSNYSRSFKDDEVKKLGDRIREIIERAGGSTEVIMEAPAWQSDPQSPFLKMAMDTFDDVLGFRPKKVAMHFALEAGYYVRKFPDCEIVSIGPRIIEPHSVTERVEISTIDNIWKVLVEMLARLAKA